MKRDSKGRFIKKDSGEVVIYGFKGFTHNMQCRGFQFKEGETYKHNGVVAVCESGFHFCENPIDVFCYYGPGTSKFHTVEGKGHIDRHQQNSKVACSEIKIGASISLHDFIGAGIKFLFNRKYNETTSNHSEANQSASSTTGYSSASSATGYRSASSATGDCSASSATGYRSASSATGYKSASSATGYSSASSATGNRSASSATGNRSASSVDGIGGAAIVTGLYGKAKAGIYGCIALAFWNKGENRAEMRCAEVGCGDGGDGKLKADVWYRLNDVGEFDEVPE